MNDLTGDPSETTFAPQMPEPPGPLPPAAPAADEAFDQPIELELTDLAYGGDAVGRYEGRAVFVTGGLPGELVRARLTRERSNYARGTPLS